MGQRLVIKILNHKGELLATQYMHWSAYTSSTIGCAEQIHSALEEMGDIKDETEFAVSLLRQAFPAAGLTEESSKAMCVKETRTLNRNEGLIDITSEGMDNTLGWAEGILEITLDPENEPLYYMDTYWTQDVEEFVDELEGCTNPVKIFKTERGIELLQIHDDKGVERAEKVPCFEIGYDSMTWEEFEKFAEVYFETEPRGWAFCREAGTSENFVILQWIE